MKKRNDPGRALLRVSLKKGHADPVGEISGMLLPESVRFYGYADMVRKIGRIYDLLGYQVPEEGPGGGGDGAKDGEGSWDGTILSGPDSLGKTPEPMKPVSPGTPAVYLTTLYRREHSWQGYLRLSGTDGNRRLPFRNVPELISRLEHYREESSGKQAV